MSKQQVEFEDALAPTDFGFIVCSETGALKGLWIPEGMDDKAVPESIVKLCKHYFGIDPNGEADAPVLH